jgi:hypothetical protein
MIWNPLYAPLVYVCQTTSVNRALFSSASAQNLFLGPYFS